MYRDILITVLTVLPLGLLGGAGAAYVWLTRGQTTSAVDPHTGGSDDGTHDLDAAGHPGEEGHDEHAENLVKLSEEAIREFGVQIAEAAGGKLERTLKLPGEIVLNADSVAHIVPRVSGMVREVRKNAGDTVEAGEVMAVMESRELAEARAADLAAEARLRLAEGNFTRVEKLVQGKIAPEQEYHDARQKLEEARIQHRETEAKLQALGIPHDQLATAPDDDSGGFSRYEIKAPFPATVVEKRITRGEVHDSSRHVFVLADLSTVWVDITVYSQDAVYVREGLKVRLSAPGPNGQSAKAEGRIFYVSPIMRESTRTGVARAIITNDNHLWKPGLFVTAEIITGQEDVDVLVPNDALQMIENQAVLFVAENGGFEKRSVALGGENDVYSEVVSGLKPGERYVAKGAFILKAELGKGTGEHEH
ncbi:MAG: efflux RND transporter periplasmic adaptor subunit [Phycisphaerae bacterium]|nr:efflux RND transporter periplasmic adaptor subunit [Phycisphaerae bacterium]